MLHAIQFRYESTDIGLEIIARKLDNACESVRCPAARRERSLVVRDFHEAIHELRVAQLRREAAELLVRAQLPTILRFTERTFLEDYRRAIELHKPLCGSLAGERGHERR